MKREIIALLAVLMLARGACAEADKPQQYFKDDQYLIQEEYVDDAGKLYVGEKGFARHVLTYDDGNHVIREEYFDENMAPICNPDGYFAVERRYDEEGRQVWVRYLDAQDQPVAVKGVMEMEQGYDDNGNLNLEVVLDGEGNRTLHPDGWCEHRITCDDANQKVAERWLGIDGEPALFKEDYSGIDRVFDENGNAIQETYRDASGEIGPNKAGIITQERRYNEDKKVVWCRYLDAQGLPMAVKGIVEMEQGYDADGNLNLEVVLDGKGNRTLHPDGWCEHRITCNEAKQKVAERYFNVMGYPALLKGDYSGVDRAFNDAGKAIRETYHDASGRVGANKAGVITVETDYNDEGRAIELRYFDAQGEPMSLPSLGAHIEQREYDEYGNVCLSRLLDADRLPTTGAKGWATAAYTFDEDKHKLSETYFGVDGAMTLIDGGYAKVVRAYDELGNVTRETYYDTSNVPADNAKGVTTVCKEYADGFKTAVYEEYRDANDVLRIDQTAGCAAIARQLDEAGNAIRESYFGTKGEAMLSPKKNYASVVRRYDDAGKVTSEAYFNASGEPMLVSGKHVLVRDYDEAGNVILEQWYDRDDRLCVSNQNWATVRRTYDEKKRLLEERYYGVDGAPTLCKDGYAAQVMTYAEGSKPITKAFFDVDGSRMIAKKEYHMVASTYDSANNVLTESYFDVDGHRVACDKGYAALLNNYDENGKISDTQYFDESGQPIVMDSGYATLDTLRDEKGNVLRETYYDADGSLMTQKDGYAIVVKTYNENNKNTSIEYHDADDNIVKAKSKGYARVEYDYDEAGNKIAERYYNVKGELTKPKPNSAAMKTWTYDANKKVLSERYFNAKGEPMETSSGYAGFINWYSADYTIMEQTYLDKNGERMTGWTQMGYCKLRKYFDQTGKLLLKEEYLDGKDNPTRTRSGYFYGKVCEYDNTDRLIREYTYGDHGQPYSGSRQYAITEYTYEEDGTKTTHHYSASGARVD